MRYLLRERGLRSARGRRGAEEQDAMELQDRPGCLALVDEEIVEPDRRIVDPHHHFFSSADHFFP